MNTIRSYETELNNISPKQWETFLLKHARLPNGKPNIDLAVAFAKTATLMDFKKYIQIEEPEAPAETDQEFLTFCGILGFGQYLTKYHDGGLLLLLRERANDPRPTIREAVVLALQNIGKHKIHRLLKYAKLWSEGTFLEQRAAVKSVCEPNLIAKNDICEEALDLLDWVTATIVEHDHNKDKGYSYLKDELSYFWSVVVSVCPEKGKPKVERWIKEKHPEVDEIMRRNLKHHNLREMDPEWSRELLLQLLPGT